MQQIDSKIMIIGMNASFAAYAYIMEMNFVIGFKDSWNTLTMAVWCIIICRKKSLYIFYESNTKA